MIYIAIKNITAQVYPEAPGQWSSGETAWAYHPSVDKN